MVPTWRHLDNVVDNVVRNDRGQRADLSGRQARNGCEPGTHTSTDDQGRRLARRRRDQDGVPGPQRRAERPTRDAHPGPGGGRPPELPAGPLGGLVAPCPACHAARHLRRGGPGGADRGEGARVVRCTRLRPQADRAQPVRGGDAAATRRGLRRRDRRGARGSDRGVLRARRRPERARRGEPAPVAHHRRDLPAGHGGAQRGEAVRRRGLRHPAYRPKGHDEVIGTTGEAPEHIHLVDGPDDVANVQVRDGAKVAWLSQTTLSVDETMATVSRLRERFPQLLDPPSDDVCYAAQNRQTAVKNIAADIDPGWLDRATTVGLTGGASVPEILVHGVLDWLAEHGYRDVHEVRSSEETVQFALPHELRRDLRGTSTGAAGTR